MIMMTASNNDRTAKMLYHTMHAGMVVGENQQKIVFRHLASTRTMKGTRWTEVRTVVVAKGRCVRASYSC